MKDGSYMGLEDYSCAQCGNSDKPVAWFTGLHDWYCLECLIKEDAIVRHSDDEPRLPCCGEPSGGASFCDSCHECEDESEDYSCTNCGAESPGRCESCITCPDCGRDFSESQEDGLDWVCGACVESREMREKEPEVSAVVNDDETSEVTNGLGDQVKVQW